jgi:NADPH:quinone reductase-like Zn-dependent oxidoreductase
VLVRVLAVALNPTDYKMIQHFPKPGNYVGCDFCGIVEEAGSESLRLLGARVSGAVFPYNPSIESIASSENDENHNNNPSGNGKTGSRNGDLLSSGSFAEWLVTDSRLLVKVPESWDDLQGAALGGVGWGTAGLALCDSDALNLSGRPSKPSKKNEPVVVWGAATASGTMACQVLKL